MRLGYMRASSDSDRQTTNLQRDALLASGFVVKAMGCMSYLRGHLKMPILGLLPLLPEKATRE